MFIPKQILIFVLRCIEGIISLILTVILVIPFLLIVWLINSTIRGIITIWFKFKYNGKIQLTEFGLGNIWGYQTPDGHNCRNVLSLVGYDHEIDGYRYRQKFLTDVINYKSSDGLIPYKNLTKIFTKYCGYYCWKNDDEFNINNHVIILPYEHIVTETELFQLLKKYSKDMDDKHPQWQEIIIPRFIYNVSKNMELSNNGNGGPQSIRILRFHHSYGDAGSWIMLYSFCMADGKIPYAVNPLKGFNIPRWKEILYYTSAWIFCATTVMRAVWGGTIVKKNRLVTNKYSGEKFYAWTDIVDLKILKDIKIKTKSSIAAILASVIGATFKRYDEKFQKNGLPGFNEITDIGAVAAVLPYPNLCLTNRFTIANFGVPTGEMNRIKRLHATSSSLLKLIQSPEPILNFWMFDFFGMFPSRLQTFMMQSAGTSMIFSNLPGASTTFYLMGDKVSDAGAWVPLLTVAGLSISATGYRDGLRICGGTDSACMSEYELHYILTTIVDEIKLLAHETIGLC